MGWPACLSVCLYLCVVRSPLPCGTCPQCQCIHPVNACVRFVFLSPCLQAKADSQVRWAVLNVVTLLRRHEPVHDALAAAMQRGASVGECIAVIERELAGAEDI